MVFRSAYLGGPRRLCVLFGVRFYRRVAEDRRGTQRVCKVSHNYRPYVTIPLLVVIDTNWLQPGETSATKHYGILKNKAIEVRPGAAKTAFSVERPAALSNKGGIINILDETGLKVDGVSYTKAQASNKVGPSFSDHKKGVPPNPCIAKILPIEKSK